MSLTFKLLSLGIRTAAKPIGNYIKRQATEHEGFRRFAIAQAQRVHRIDMRLRLGLLHDPEAQRRMHEREQRAAEEKKRKADAPTVRSEEEQKKYDDQQARAKSTGGEKAESEVKKEKEKQRIKIRPLSDARAIELGANFFSEAFIFFVAVTLILAENYRSSRKSSQRRDEVSERLDALESQVTRLEQEHHLPELEALNEKIKKSKEARSKLSWYNPAGWWRRTELPDDDDEGIPGEVEGSGGHRIPGNVPGPSPAENVKVKSEPTGTSALNDTSSPGRTYAPAPQRVDSVHATKKER